MRFRAAVLLKKSDRLLMAILKDVKPLPFKRVDRRAFFRDHHIEQHEPRVCVQGSSCLSGRYRFSNTGALAGILVLGGGGMNHRENGCGGKQKKRAQECHDDFLNVLRREKKDDSILNLKSNWRN